MCALKEKMRNELRMCRQTLDDETAVEKNVREEKEE
jgi:hypothetical protein